ncbi:hypothetical protein GEMRC1_005106 [Eukaryota sp. GEM-RC1]
MNVSFITDLIAGQLPDHFEIDLYHFFSIDFNQIDYYLDVECISNCEILDHGSLLGSLNFSFYSSNQGENCLFFELIRQNVFPPTFDFASSLLFSTVDDVIVRISILAQCPLFSEFQITNSLVFYDQITFAFNEFAVFPFSYTYAFNISSFRFSLGESDLQWTWKHVGFKNQIIGDIKIFNTDFTSSNHVSVYEHRDIHADFSGPLISQFKCVVGDNSFFASVSNSTIICKNLIISTFQVIVPVNVYSNDLFINSFSVQGEAFLEEMCFLLDSHHPLIQNSRYTTNILNDLVFDGSRCCNVDVSFCSEFWKSSQNISVQFNTSVDIFHVVITTNSSCGDFDFDLPFELMVNNQSLSPSFSCKQIPSGFSFALMCGIDNVIPEVNEIVLIPRHDVFLLELEFYGYQSYTCLTLVDINKGITSLGEEIEETIQLKLGNET